MIQFFMRCPYCNHPIVYTLNTGQKKCSLCKKKYSPKKIDQRKKIIDAFVNGSSVYKAAKELSLNYVTVKKQYENFRKKLIPFLEEQYQSKEVKEYDEYVYMEKSKRFAKEYIFDAQNFLTFDYGGKVYNLLMPSLIRFKEQLLYDGSQEKYFNEFSKFMRFHKISKIEEKENTIRKFWRFFEESIVTYKGIDRENFFYYLKEFEFKFNYDEKEQKTILYNII